MSALGLVTLFVATLVVAGVVWALKHFGDRRTLTVRDLLQDVFVTDEGQSSFSVVGIGALDIPATVHRLWALRCDGADALPGHVGDRVDFSASFEVDGVVLPILHIEVVPRSLTLTLTPGEEWTPQRILALFRLLQIIGNPCGREIVIGAGTSDDLNERFAEAWTAHLGLVFHSSAPPASS